MNRHRFGDLALVVTIGVFWGLNWPSVKFILGEVPPWTLRAIGFTVGAILLTLFARLNRQSLWPAPDERWRLTLAGLLTVFGFNMLTAFGQLLTETSRAAIIAFTMPMWAAGLSVLFLRESLTAARVASLCVGMLGLVLLMYDGVGSIRRDPAGPMFMLGSALSWAAGTVILKTRDWSIKPIAQAAWMVSCSAPPAIIAALMLEKPLALSMPTLPVLATLAYHIIFPMAICYVAWVSLVGRLPVSVAAIGTLLIPVVGVISASLLLGDILTWQKLLALALVLSSIALTFVNANRPRLK
ncbi:MAG: DMT family transporter [Gammaproteobacteria bacterium]